MRKFTLTAIVTQDNRVVGAFQLLSLRPQLDREILQEAVGKFIEKPYQKIVYGANSMIYLDPKLAAENSYTCAHAEVIAFAVWRAAGALLHSKSLETEVLKHGSNWLVTLDDEPYLVKFILEDQAQNYIVLNALPDLEVPIVIKDSGWLPTSVPAELGVAGDETYALESTEPTIGSMATAAPRPILNGVWDTSSPKEETEREQALGQLGYRTIGHWPVTEETVEVVQLDEDTKRDPNALLSAAPQCTETGIRDSSQFGDSGFARPKEVPEHNQVVGDLGHESPALEVGEDTAETAVLPDTVLEPARISSAGVHMQMKKEFEFSQEDPGPTEILAALKKGYMDGAKSTALDSGMFEKPVSEGFAEGLGEIYDRMVDDRLASKALLSDEQDGFLAEAALRGQNAAIVMLDESPYIPSEEVREAAKAVLLESNPVYNHYENGSDISTNHTELNNPTLEI